MSGPSLDHLAHLLRHTRGRRLQMAEQALRSWYTYAFQLPVLPELVWPHAGPVLVRMAASQGADHWGPELAHNAAHGVNLYRANLRGRLARRGSLQTDVPVQVVHPTRDRFVGAVTLEDLDAACGDLSVVEVEAGHWLTRTHPDEVAHLVTHHVRAHAGSG